LMSGRNWEGDLQYRNLKTGRLTDVHATTFTIKDPATGKPLYLANVSLNITERKRLEAQLIESQRLAAIGETTTMVGHDLRNPLQAMTGTLYLVKKLAMSEEVEDRKEAVGLLGRLDDAIRYMDKIVSDLQDYARPVGADSVQANLPDLVKAIVSNVKIPRGVNVSVDIQDGSSNLRLDPVLFRRVLTNLILNAVQSMPNGGRLTIAGSTTDGSLTVAVQDTGIGIAPENLAKIFNPFFTTKAQGQGLGLAVCKRLVEAQNGTITVKSEIGCGSTFTLKIPIN
jgi:signal transduction histidine kinase